MEFAGQVGVNPRKGSMLTTDTLDVITQTGYLNKNTVTATTSFLPSDVLFVAFNNGYGGVDTTLFSLDITPNGTITLVAPAGIGSVREIDTGNGLQGGPITDIGTISLANSSPDSLAGYDDTGVFSNVSVGSGLALSGGVLTSTGSGGTVTSISGTNNRITATPNPITSTGSIDISASYAGQTSINTVGNILTGIWSASVISPTYGGTGVNNGSNTITLGGNIQTADSLTTVGAYSATFNFTGSTNVTFPTSGTLSTSTGTVTSISEGTGITCTPNPITSTGTVAISNTAVTAGTYSFPINMAVNAQGQITAITSDGSDNLTSSTGNLFIGQAGNNTTTGVLNVGVGYGTLTDLNNSALTKNNTGFGFNVLPIMPGGQHNTAIGSDVAVSMNGLRGGTSDNVLIGYNVAPSATQINKSVIIGSTTGSSATQYSDCVLIGYNTYSSTTFPTNAIVLGYNAFASVDNCVILGANNNVGIYSNSPIYTLDIGNPGGSNDGIRIADNSGSTPATPTNTNDLVIYNNGGIFQLLDTSAGLGKAAFGTLTLTNALGANYGGTGVLNSSSSTITLGGAFAMSGAYTFTGNLTADTNVTFPTSGTLSTTTGTVTSITAGTGLSGGTITGSGTISLSTPVSLTNGGTNASLTANNGGIVWSNASQLQILSGTSTANQVLLSGATATPVWSTATYQATTTANQLLYSSSNNVIAGLATANQAVLVTNVFGAPSLSTSLPGTVQLNITNVGTITAGTWEGSLITGTYGGTGVNNGSSTITIGGNVTFSGAYAFTGTLTNTTSVTFPTSGTLIEGANTAPSVTFTGPWSSTQAATCYFGRAGKVVTMSIPDLLYAISGSTNTTNITSSGAVPSGYRPPFTVSMRLQINVGTSGANQGTLSVNSSGTITIQTASNPNSASSSWAGTSGTTAVGSYGCCLSWAIS